jgi:hypothetical protein
VVASTSSSKNKTKMELQSILSKNLPFACTKLELGMLGIARKLVKRWSSLPSKKNWKKEKKKTGSF